MTTSVFLPVETPSGTKLIEQKLRVPGNVEPRMATLNYLLAHSKILPKSTRVLGLFLDKDHVLTIEFSPELKKFASGSTQEALTLAALSATIARFDGVKSFRLTVLNRPVTNLSGHVDLSEPYPAEKALPEEFR